MPCATTCVVPATPRDPTTTTTVPRVCLPYIIARCGLCARYSCVMGNGIESAAENVHQSGKLPHIPKCTPRTHVKFMCADFRAHPHCVGFILRGSLARCRRCACRFPWNGNMTIGCYDGRMIHAYFPCASSAANSEPTNTTGHWRLSVTHILFCNAVLYDLHGCICATLISHSCHGNPTVMRPRVIDCV